MALVARFANFANKAKKVVKLSKVAKRINRGKEFANTERKLASVEKDFVSRVEKLTGEKFNGSAEKAYKAIEKKSELPMDYLEKSERKALQKIGKQIEEVNNKSLLEEGKSLKELKTEEEKLAKLIEKKEKKLKGLENKKEKLNEELNELSTKNYKGIEKKISKKEDIITQNNNNIEKLEEELRGLKDDRNIAKNSYDYTKLNTDATKIREQLYKTEPITEQTVTTVRNRAIVTEAVGVTGYEAYSKQSNEKERFAQQRNDVSTKERTAKQYENELKHETSLSQEEKARLTQKMEEIRPSQTATNPTSLDEVNDMATQKADNIQQDRKNGDAKRKSK